jgi:thymidylate synthase
VTFTAPIEFNVLHHPVRDLNYRFMIAEWLWMSLGREDVDSLDRYNSIIKRFSDDGKTFAGAYGPRWIHQRRYVLDCLTNDPDSRQALATLWSPNPRTSKDIPCTIMFQFMIRDKKLHMTAKMRSSDIWLGLPYDFFNFSQLGNEVAGEMGLERGTLTMELTSSHIYEDNLEKGKLLLLSKESVTALRSPRRIGFTTPAMNTFLLQPTGGGSVGWKLTKQDEEYAMALSSNKEHALEVLRGLSTQP